MKSHAHWLLLPTSFAFLALALLTPAEANWLTVGALVRLAIGDQPVQADRYIGSFRVPLGDGSGINKNSHQYEYGGDVAAAEGQTLWLSTHAHALLVGRVTIPDPFQPTAIDAFSELPIAAPQAPAVEITGGLRAASLQDSHWPMVLSDVVVDGERLWWVFHNKYNVAQKRYRVLGSYDPQTNTAAGPYQLVNSIGRPVRSQLTGRSLAAIPDRWATVLDATYLCGGGGLPGQGRTGAGPSLYAFTPPEAGADPATAKVTTQALLIYPFDKDRPESRRRALPGWNLACVPFDAVWVDDSVICLVRRALGPVWYGPPDGPGDLHDPYFKPKSFHAERYVMQFLFYDARDLVAVATGQKKPWEPQPYAITPVPHLMDSNHDWAQTRPVSLSWDPKTERLYVIQARADRSRSKYAHQPVIHVFDLGPVKSIRAWAEKLGKADGGT